MRKIGEELLFGVGRGPARIDANRHIVHVRKPLTDEEIALLPRWFLESPAIDLAGT